MARKGLIKSGISSQKAEEMLKSLLQESVSNRVDQMFHTCYQSEVTEEHSTSESAKEKEYFQKRMHIQYQVFAVIS